MKIVTIGRSSSNEVKIEDPLVSRVHCQVIQDDYGNFKLVDTNSKNGIYVNGVKQRHREIRLNPSDVVRIGNTTLPWQSYFHPVRHPHPEPPVGPQTPPVGKTRMGLGILALVLSLINLGIVIYIAAIAIKGDKFGLFGLGYAYYSYNIKAFIWISVILGIVASVLGAFGDDDERYKDAGAASAAKWLSSLCFSAVVIFIIYCIVQYHVPIGLLLF